MKRIHPLWFVIIIIIGAYFWNVQSMRRNNPEQLTKGGTFYNIDNYWYKSQFKNLVDHGSFTIDIRYPEYRVRRTPLYPLFLGVPLYFFGEGAGNTVVLILQVLLHLLAAYLMGRMVLTISGNRRLERLAVLIYGLCPFIFIYSFYTLTESLTPFLTVAIFYGVVKYHYNPEKRIKWLVLTAAILGIAILVRPLMGLFAIPLGLYFFLVNYSLSLKSAVRSGFLFGVVLLGILAPWLARNYRLTGEPFVLEKWYYEDPMDFGKGHTYLRKWLNAFTIPANLSLERLGYSIRNARTPAEAEENVSNYLEAIPEWVYKLNGRKEVENGFRLYTSCLMDRQQLKNAGVDLKQLAVRNCEEELKNHFSNLTRQIRDKQPRTFYLTTPGVTLLRGAIFQSFSFPWPALNGNSISPAIKKMAKAIFIFLNVTLWFGLVALFQRRQALPFLIRFTIGLSVLIFVIFHIWIFRYFEARYFLPLYPVLILSTIFLIHRWLNPSLKNHSVRALI